jgi:hypothetical protein
MRGSAKGVRLALSDDVLSKVCQLPTTNGRVKDDLQLRHDIQRIVDKSWSLHWAVKAIPWPQLIKLESSKLKAYAAFMDARDDLKVVLHDPQAKLDVLAARTDSFQKKLHKLQSTLDRFASAWKFLDRVKSAKEKHELIDAWSVVLNYGFGSRQVPPTVPEFSIWGRAQLDAAEFSAAIAAVKFNIKSAEQRDRFLRDLVGLPSKRERGRGRPVDSKTHLECRLFVRNLLDAVGNAGGKLGFDKNLKRGTLLDAL